MIQQTSLEAYEKVVRDLGYRQKQVYDVIVSHPGFCNKEIAQYLMLPINSITGRVKELRDMCLVLYFGKKKYNNCSVMTWIINIKKNNGGN